MGEPETKVDLLILGDGYTAQQRGKFEEDAKRATEILFSRSPFKEHRKEFNVWGLCPAADQPGIVLPVTQKPVRHMALSQQVDSPAVHGSPIVALRLHRQLRFGLLLWFRLG